MRSISVKPVQTLADTKVKVRELTVVDTRVPFVGRVLELDQVLDSLKRGGVLTLVGPGGVGKSRLAYEAMRRFEEQSRRRAVFVRLAGLDPEAVVGTVMHELGIHDEPTRTPIATFRDVLTEAPVTLVLDNCEHAPDQTSELIDAIGSVPGVAILATSQRRLDYTDEVVFEVQPFSHDDAVEFFLARAQIERTNAQTATLETISQIVDRLDGLAVALDLAAARLASLSLEELAHELEELRPYHLRSTRGSEPRHRTIGNVIAWTYGRLDDEAKRVFALSSLFADVFDDQDICALAGVDEDTARALLDELATHSLVVRAEFGARMLAPIRAVAARMLATMPNRRAIDETFAKRMNALAAEIWLEMRGSDAGAAMQRLFVRYADFCASLAWALKRPNERIDLISDVTTATMAIWAEGGRYTEGLRWTERLESVAERLSPATRGRMYYLGLVVAHAASDYRRMVESGPQMISAFTIAGDRLGLARAYNALATAAINTGRSDEAETYVDTALRLYQQLNHDRGIGVALINKGAIQLDKDDAAQARALFQQARAILEPLGSSPLTGIAIGNLAEVEYTVFEYDRSTELAHEAIDHFEASAALPMIAWQYQTLARIALARG
ncbi:MAG TPA: tetratricopeptide repeat protein, partial [Candidatus Baltobacteraceae bacterium]|nr:tetratricopeptide repeat protein [Candidatus Baltobacteraceae bacterium]